MTTTLTLTSRECWLLPVEGDWTLDDALDALTGKFALTLNRVPIKYALPIPGQAFASVLQCHLYSRMIPFGVGRPLYAYDGNRRKYNHGPRFGS
jgi:hypothetical protein